MKIEESVPDKGMEEIDRIAGLAQCREGSVGEAFETKGGLVESKTDEDAGGGEDHPGDAGGNIYGGGVKEQKGEAGGETQGADHRGD